MVVHQLTNSKGRYFLKRPAIVEAELSEGLCMIQAARQNNITWNSLIKQQLIQFDLETEGFPESLIPQQTAGRQAAGGNCTVLLLTAWGLDFCFPHKEFPQSRITQVIKHLRNRNKKQAYLEQTLYEHI